MLRPHLPILLLLIAGSAAAKPVPMPKSDTSFAAVPDHRPVELREMLHAADSCVIGKACGKADRPWVYRGEPGLKNSVRLFGAQRRGAEFTHALASLLVDGVAIDSAHTVRPLVVSCDSGDSIPVFLVRFDRGDDHTRALLRFDTGQVLFYGDRIAFGAARMGERADTLWSLLREVLTWDGYLAAQRPEPGDGKALEVPGPHAGDFVYVDELPNQIYHQTPTYPVTAIHDGVEGLVLVSALIGVNGLVEDAYIADGPPALFDASLEAAWQYRFRSAKVGGKKVPVWVLLPMTYRLH